MTRINFTVAGPACKVPAYARRTEATEYDSAGGVAAAALARKNSLHVVAVGLNSETPSSFVYEATLGHPCPGGGWTPDWTGWIYVQKEVSR